MALGLVLAVALLVAFGAAVGEAQTGDSPSLSLEPSSGREGTSVTAIVSGFEDCEETDGTDDGTDDDGDVVVDLVAEAVAQPGGALILWDGSEQVGRVDLALGRGETPFTVPAGASFDPHRVVARCDLDGSLEAAETFVVEPPVAVPTVVPDVIDSTLEEATAALVEADLVLGAVTGDGEVIRDQRPRAGTEVEPGTAVDLDLGVVPVRVPVPDLVGQPVDAVAGLLEDAGLTLGGASGEGDLVVRQSPLANTELPLGSPVDIVRGAVAPEVDVEVPDLTDVAVDDVPAVLAARGLVLGVVRGEGDVVRDQEPAPGTVVPSGSAVNVSVESDVDPVVLVAVPDLGGLTADEARTRLEAIGLVLGGGLEGDEEVAAHVPPPDTLVTLGSVVTASTEAPPPPETSWPAILTAAAASLLAAWLVRRVLRARRDRRWVRRHVRVERGPTTSGGATVHQGDDARPTHVIRLEPHLDSDHPTLEEVVP